MWLRQLLCLLLFWTAIPASAENLFVLPNGDELAPLAVFQECDVCPEMIVMPLGSFMMGARPEDSRNPFDFYGDDATGTVRRPDEVNIIPSEHPRHPVEMDIPFAMGRNEVTHAEWMNCVEAGGCSHNPDHRVLTFEDGYVALGPHHPVINISYLDTLEYVAWLNGEVGHELYRLPTRAEWEYAARAGTDTRFAQGDELTSDQANFSRAATENLRKTPMPELESRYMPVPVDDLDAANGWGLRHMSGNVIELTLSCWTPEQLGLASARLYLQRALSHSGCQSRVAKGGSFNTAMDMLRPAANWRPLETTRRDNQGFRLIREFEMD